MSLTASDVKKISHLARLAISEADIQKYTSDLSNILDTFAVMNEANVDGVVPMANPQDSTQRLREDVVTEVNARDKFQAIAPNTESGLYLVPKVLE